MNESLSNDQCVYCGYEGGKHNEVCIAAENERLRKDLGMLAVQALQRDWEDILDWARTVRVTFPNGDPELVSALENVK